MSLRRIRTGVVCVAIAVSLSACGSSPSPTPTIEPPVFSNPYLTNATIRATFRAHGILLQKTFGDNLQASYDGISSTALGVHVVGLIVYPRQKQGALVQRGGVGNPVVIANVDVWIDPGLSKRFHADAEAAIAKLTSDCRCENPSFALLSTMVPLESGEWSGQRWRLLGADLPSHQYCVALTSVSPVGRWQTCGTMQNPPTLKGGSPYIPASMSVTVAPQIRLLPGSVFGVVVSTVSNVQITFTNGTIETVRPVAPPPALRSGLLDFYVARRPCGTTYTTIVGRNANGKIIARAKRLLGPYALEQREDCST